MADSPHYTFEQVAAALEHGAGINLAAAAILKCSPSTITSYLQRYPELAEVKRQAREDILDLAESKLVQAIRADKEASIHFFLRTQGKDRGYTTRVEQVGKNGRPLPSAGRVTIVQLPDNQRAVIPPEPSDDGDDGDD